MTQKHFVQAGTFHITTTTASREPWCNLPGVPQMIIDNLCMSRNVHGVKLHAFCILPDHIHLILSCNEKGFSSFMHSFKKTTSRDVSRFLGGSDFRIAAAEVKGSRSGGSKTAASPVLPLRVKWQKGYHDELIRTSVQRSTALAYVQGNAMKHELVHDILDWPWTSLHFEHLSDPLEVWLD
jgi:REP element-mobilizing transposase RayT